MRYVLEIKNRIILIIINSLSTMFSCYFYKEILLFTILKSYNNFETKDFYFIFTGITEVFSVYLDVFFFFSYQIFLIYTAYSVFIFFLPALFLSEYKYLRFVFKLLIFAMPCFIFIFLHFFVPYTWKFFVSFQTFSVGQSFYFEAKLTEYINFYISTYNFCSTVGGVFLFFLFYKSMYLNTKSIKKYRKIYYYFFIIFASLISPPEVYSQLLISLILIIIYEFVIFLFMLAIH